MITYLEKTFAGKGEVSGVKFEQVYSDQKYYIYKRSDNGYELFKKQMSPICIDFEKRIFSETEFKETYPKSNSFGVTAWHFNRLQDALNKIDLIENSQK